MPKMKNWGIYTSRIRFPHRKIPPLRVVWVAYRTDPTYIRVDIQNIFKMSKGKTPEKPDGLKIWIGWPKANNEPTTAWPLKDLRSQRQRNVANTFLAGYCRSLAEPTRKPLVRPRSGGLPLCARNFAAPGRVGQAKARFFPGKRNLDQRTG